MIGGQVDPRTLDDDALTRWVARGDALLKVVLRESGPLPVEVEELRTAVAIGRIELRRRRADRVVAALRDAA